MMPHWPPSCCLLPYVTEALVQADDLDISPSKIGESAQRLVDRAAEEARRREHPLVANEHLFVAFAQVEWDTFAELMRDIDANPHAILQAVDDYLHEVPP